MISDSSGGIGEPPSLALCDPAGIRTRSESRFATELAATGLFEDRAAALPAAERVRRRLLSGHLRLSESMVPELFEQVRTAAAALKLERPIEIYQANGQENAANWTCADIVFISLQGAMMTQLDRDSMIALLGHEFGHHLAHTHSFDDPQLQLAARSASCLAHDPTLPDEIRLIASHLSMAREFTADRYAALACGSLDGPIRLMMAIASGLPAQRLVAEAPTYIAQAHALFGNPEDDADHSAVGSHPEHLLRTYALALFAETAEFRAATGQGSGQRSLAEVDTILEKILAAAPATTQPSDAEPLPPEVHEFALCAAVLIAASDGALDEAEIEILEQTFADLLPAWAELLDPARALARFSELLPLACQGGENHAASIFQLLFHVMIADREVHLRELEMIARVGRSLGQESLFDALLSAAARELKLQRSSREIELPLPALPPGKRETQAALDALFAAMARRGSGALSIARALRLLGADHWTPERQQQLLRAAAAHHLELDEDSSSPSSATAPEQHHLLRFHLSDTQRRRRERRSEAAGPLAQATNRDALKTALQALRERLVSGDGRSPSVRLYRCANGRHVDLEGVEHIVAGRAERLITQLSTAAELALLSGEEAASQRLAQDYARSLLHLEREAKARREETGAEDFFVGYPFLIGRIGSFFVRAPLALHPFSLVGDGRGASNFVLRRRGSESANANQALLRLLFAKKGFSFTDEVATCLDAQAAEGVDNLLEELRRLGLEVAPLSGAVRPFEPLSAAASALLPEGFQVAESAVLGFFPQSSSDLIHDYDDLLSALNSSSAEALAAELNSATALLPAELRTPFAAHPSRLPDRPVIYADPSQRAVIHRAREARLLVMDGPPGTGKSQTIVNLVADALDQGHKVAVICEKRVALDVVKQRLDSAGLGHLAAVVHDVNSDRKEVCRRIADRLESERPGRSPSDDARLDALHIEINQLQDELAARLQALATPAWPGFTLARLHELAAALEFPTLSADAGSALVPLAPEQLDLLASQFAELQPHAELFLPQSPFADPARPSLAGQDRTALHQISEQLQHAVQTRDTYESTYQCIALDPEHLEAAAVALHITSSCTDPSASTDSAPALDPHTLGSFLRLRVNSPERAGEVEESLATLERLREPTLAEAERVTTTAEAVPGLDHALTDARRLGSNWLRHLQPAWHRARKTLLQHLLLTWPDQAQAKLDPTLLTRIERRRHAALAWSAAESLYRALGIPASLPRQAPELYATLPAQLRHWQTSAALLQQRPALETLNLWPLPLPQPGTDPHPSTTANHSATSSPSPDWSAWLRQLAEARALLQAQRAYHQAIVPAAHWLPVASNLDAAALQHLAHQFTAAAPQLAQADQILARASSTTSAAPTLFTQLVTLLPPPASAADWTDALRASWAEASIAHLEAQHPQLALLDQPPSFGNLEASSARLLILHQQLAVAEASRIARTSDQLGLMAIEPAAARARRSPQQATRETLIRECRKQRQLTPLRTLVRRHAADGILDVLPVWLMSPETTAILFPRQPVFDLLIIDEASQCTVENGLPVLTRARRTVVAGDDKQMPPTSFFQSGGGLSLTPAEVDPASAGIAGALAGILLARTENESQDESEDDQSSANGDNPIDIAADSFESESLLALARQDAAQAPLRWHYRARFEELIAFSNHSMYGGSLLTIPSITSRSAPPALSWELVPDGLWDARANPPEARRVVDLVHDRLRRPQPPTIGIVTFNLSQRRAILDEIDRRRGEDETFAQLWDRAASAELLDQRPFVKNLESVQGDERDSILFSLGYAPTTRKRKDGSEERYVPARFGPLGQKGGERRLNVAVSRAKEEIVVVSSFDPALLSVAHAKHDGPRLFKSFLEYTRHLAQGNRAQADKVLQLVNDQRVERAHGPRPPADPAAAWHLPLLTQIAQTLQARGHQLETQIGTSEFQLPIALLNPLDPSHYRLALLIDDGTQTDPYEQFVHIPNVLHHRGWQNHLRLTPRDWHRHRPATLARIESALEKP